MSRRPGAATRCYTNVTPPGGRERRGVTQMARRPGVEGVTVLRECHAAGGLRASRCYANVTPTGG
eukprot:1184512-Prorocentrum_minimum.AAC.3